MIAFQHVSVTRSGPRAAQLLLEDVSFSIDPGEVFGVTGPKGAGKSSLLRTVNGLIRPTQGDVVVDGQPLSGFNDRELPLLRRKVGMILPEPALAGSLSLAENIALPLMAAGMKNSEIGPRVEELLALTGIEGLGGTPANKLTLQQQKRGAIARALASKPKILLCLEPAYGLEPAAGEEILTLLENIQKESSLTILLSTRDVHAVKRLCSRAAVLDGGKVVELNDTYSLFSKPEHPFTREFLSGQLSFALPAQVREHAYGAVVCIEYMGEAANEPVLYEVAQRFGVEFNILQGHIEYIGGKALGRMYVSFNAEPALMVSVLSYLKEHTYRAEVVQDV
jgi:D-methionine transport system ATP-binding protein